MFNWQIAMPRPDSRHSPADACSMPLPCAARRASVLGLVGMMGALLAMPVMPALAEAFPSRPIRIIVPGGPGAGMDVQTRVLAEAMAANLGVSVVVENRTGAAGVIGLSHVAQSAPDGYTLGVAWTGMTINPLLLGKSPFDVERAFAPVSQFSAYPMVLVASRRSAGAADFRKLMASAAAGERITFGVTEGTSRLATELFKKNAGATGFDIIQYKTGSQMMTDLRGGHVNAALTSAGTALPFLQDPEVSVLAIAAPKRLAALPDVPTLAEQGMPGFSADIWMGLVAPRGTPAPVVARLNQAVAQALATPAVQRSIQSQMAVVTPSTPADFAQLIRNESRRWKEVADAAGIVPQG